MNYSYDISFLTCQSCTAKIHCDDCSATLRERLLGRPGIQAAEVDVSKRRLLVSTDMDADDLLDLLENLGVFAD